MASLLLVLTLSFAVQAAGALILAFVLLSFHRVYRKPYLRHWAWSWLAFGLHLALNAATLTMLESFAAQHPLRVALTASGSFAAYLQVAWLLYGAYEIARGETPARRIRLAVLALAAAMAVVTTLAFLTVPGGDWLRYFSRVGVRALVGGLAFVVAGYGVWPPPGAEAKAGRRIVSIAFWAYGAQLLHHAGIAVVNLVAAEPVSYAPFLGLVDFLIQWVMGIGMVVCLLEDERASAVRAARTAEHLAYHDALTGLPNRRLLLDRLTLALPHARRAGEKVGLLYVDLDRFKVINDSLGHAAGDRLLEEVGRRLGRDVREGDTLARIGGDEFTLVLPGIARAEDAGMVAQKLIDGLREPFVVDGQELFVTPSIGVAVFPNDGADAETLIKHADIAMYRAKEGGGDGFTFFAREMNERARERLATESALRKAPAAGQLVLHWQPICDGATGRVTGVEALLRWNHPERGLLLPEAFIEVAEATGLIAPIGEWVMRTACARAKAWHDAGHGGLSVAVNLSARQFALPDLVARVRGALEDTGLRADALELEITESLAMRHAASTELTLRELAALGVRVSIDDFGTGHSSFAYLQRFPIHTLKVDREFIRAVDRDAGSAAIVSAILGMAHRLGLGVVAEGVERPAQLDFLRAHGCDRVQGFFLSPPVPAEELGAVLRARGVREAAAAGAAHD